MRPSVSALCQDRSRCCVPVTTQKLAGGISRAGKEGMPSAERDCTVAQLNVIFALVRYAKALSRRIQLRLSIKINQLLTYTHTCGPTRVMRVISPVSFVRGISR